MTWVPIIIIIVQSLLLKASGDLLVKQKTLWRSKGVEFGHPYPDYRFCPSNEQGAKSSVDSAPFSSSSLSICHLLFVDDVLIFGDVTISEWKSSSLKIRWQSNRSELYTCQLLLNIDDLLDQFHPKNMRYIRLST